MTSHRVLKILLLLFFTVYAVSPVAIDISAQSLSKITATAAPSFTATLYMVEILFGPLSGGEDETDAQDPARHVLVFKKKALHRGRYDAVHRHCSGVKHCLIPPVADPAPPALGWSAAPRGRMCRRSSAPLPTFSGRSPPSWSSSIEAGSGGLPPEPSSARKENLMGIFDKLLGRGKDFPQLEPSHPAAARLGALKEQLEPFVKKVSDKLEIVPLDQEAVVFVGEPPDAFGAAWIRRGGVSNFKKLMQDRKLPPDQVQMLSDRLRDAYVRSKDEPRYAAVVAEKLVVITPSEILERDVAQIFRQLAG